MEINLFREKPETVSVSYSYSKWEHGANLLQAVDLGPNYLSALASLESHSSPTPEGHVSMFGVDGENGWASLMGDEWEIIIGMESASDHLPQDAVCATIVKIQDHTGREKEVAIIAFADGMTNTVDESGRNEIASDTSGQIAKESVMVAVENTISQIKEKGTYDTELIPEQIREVLRAKGLRNGATTLNLLVVIPDEDSSTYSINTHSFAGEKDNGVIIHYLGNLLVTKEPFGYKQGLRYFIQPDDYPIVSTGEFTHKDKSYNKTLSTDTDTAFTTDGVSFLNGKNPDDKTLILIRRKRKNN